jgi:hypothetical protein
MASSTAATPSLDAAERPPFRGHRLFKTNVVERLLAISKEGISQRDLRCIMQAIYNWSGEKGVSNWKRECACMHVDTVHCKSVAIP